MKENSIMRIFNESLTGEIVENPDYDHGKVTPTPNPITAEYEVTVPEEGEYVTVQTYPNGGKDVEYQITQEEEGEWKIYDHRGDVKRDITDLGDWDFDKYIDKNMIYEDNETVGIYHEYDEDEQEEYDQLKANEQHDEEKAEYYEDLYTDNGSNLTNLLGDITELGGSLSDYLSSIEGTLDDILNSGGAMTNATD